MAPRLLLIVAESYWLTGLGVLAIARQSEPPLREFALHTKLDVSLTFPDGHQQTVPASVEEIARPVEPPGEAPTAHTDAVLLLESELVTDLPPGTEIWWTGGAGLLR